MNEKERADSSVSPFLFCTSPILHEYIATGRIVITFPSIPIIPRKDER